MAMQRRLEVVEEMVEKTVEHLATEVKGLLGLLEELAWNLPPGPFSPAPDLLGEGEQCRWQRTASQLLSSGAGQARQWRRLDSREGPSAPGDGRGTASPLLPNPHPVAAAQCQDKIRKEPALDIISTHPSEEKLPPSLAFSGLKLLSSFHFPLRSPSCSTPKPSGKTAPH
ncbi:hypothetical protein P7K49_023656 [Saguinus oedipus]|uniref:Uncharacterized protein n=1 Tax=Saguinus oedipus TaxID=9490 RepID=A0ABQ9UN16_SAGOE|nr:hypothetical protein P7K49_023656 [Saguinus oedipus]